MNRRDFFKTIGLGSVAMVLPPSLYSTQACTHTVSKAGKNILFISVDDLRPQLGCYGQKQIISPNIDKLAADGTLFERAYCQQAVCAPSRISLLSGLRPDTTGITDLYHPLKDVAPDTLTLPKFFKQHGYETVSIGKVYHHKNDDPDGWSIPAHRVKGKWKKYGYLAPESIKLLNDQKKQIEKEKQEYLKKNKNDPAAKKKHWRNPVGPPFEAADVPDNAYPDGAQCDYAINELTRLSKQNGIPFFLAVGFFKPHLPFNAPKKYWEMYPESKIKLPDNPFPPKGSNKYTMNWCGELGHYSGVKLDKKGQPIFSDKEKKKLIQGYSACVTYTDTQIGRLISTLDKLGLRDNTIIVLWGDHGWKLGDHGNWCKHTNLEIDTHAPLIIDAPGYKNGQRSNSLVEFVDVYPTLAELCGFTVPKHCEGVSLIPLLKNPKAKFKAAAFSQYPRKNGIMGYTMKTHRYRYTEWRNMKTGKIEARELYDHKKDSQENENVINKPEYADTIKKMKQLIIKDTKI